MSYEFANKDHNMFDRPEYLISWLERCDPEDGGNCYCTGIEAKQLLDYVNDLEIIIKGLEAFRKATYKSVAGIDLEEL